MRFIIKPIAWALIACLVNNPIYGFYFVTGLIFFKPFPALADEFLNQASEGQSVGAGLMGKSIAAGLVAGVLALCTRICGRTPATLALLLLIGTAFDSVLTFRTMAWVVWSGTSAPQPGLRHLRYWMRTVWRKIQPPTQSAPALT